MATGSVHSSVGDGDVFAAAKETAADAGTKSATGSVHCAAGDGDVFAVAALTAAADAGTIQTTGSVHRAALDGDVFAAAPVAAADAGTIFATGGLQAAGFVFIVLQGQRAFRGVFFKARPVSAAFQLVIAVQLDLHIALSLNAQGGFSFYSSPWDSGVAHIDLYVFQGEVQHLIGTFVDHRNDVFAKAISWGRGCRGGSSSRGCLLVCVFLPVSVLRLLSVLLLVGSFRFLSALLPVGAFRLVCIFRFFSALWLGRLVVVLYHRAKAGVLCCGAFQVALQRGGGLFMGGDDDLLIVPNLLCRIAALLDSLFAILIFGDGNVAVVDVVGPCKGRSRQRHRDAQRCQQSCCPAECAVLLHCGLLSFSTLSCAFCALFVEGAFSQIVPPPPIFSIGENNKVFTQNPHFCSNMQQNTTNPLPAPAGSAPRHKKRGRRIRSDAAASRGSPPWIILFSVPSPAPPGG